MRNRGIFDFVRSLKAIDDLDDSPANLRALCRKWLDRAVHARTKDWRENWTDFRIAWERVKTPAGQTIQDIGKLARAGVAEQLARTAFSSCRRYPGAGPGVFRPIRCLGKDPGSAAG